jgi:hypothetical protein
MVQDHAMFMIDEAEARAIRQAYEEGGASAAVAELRRHFTGLGNDENTRRCMRMIVGPDPAEERSTGR